jgi:RHS repeat-associated protein
MIDALQRSTLEGDDAFQRLVRKDVYEDDKQVSSIHWEYEATGKLVKQHTIVKIEGNPLREYGVLRDYNSRGFLIAETELPQGKTTYYTYDQRGRLIQKQKPDGISLYFAYDALGRLQAMASTDGMIHYTYNYDLHDNPIEIRDLVYHTIQKRVYDLFNRLIEEELSPGLTIKYAYDPLDRVTQITLPDGSFALYTYDTFHLRKIQRFNSAGQLSYEYACQAYDQQGNLLKGLSPAGETTYTYDLLGRPTGIQTAHWNSYLEQFDPVGNLLTMRKQDPSGERKGQFTYDRFNHLAFESLIDDNHYFYDSIGNCFQKNKQLLEVNSLNQLINDGHSQYCYDLNGNLLTQTNPAISYQYDALNRLIKCTQNGVQTSFIYDSFGRCLFILDTTGQKQLLYQGNIEIGSLLNGQLQEFRLIHPEASREKTFAIELNGEAFFPLQDHYDNICALQKRDGNLVEWYHYSAFGIKSVNGEKVFFNPWGFANRREAAGLLLFAHRFYNPHLMRWQTTDPLGFEDGLNLYTYVRNNPFKYKDPDGRFVFAIPIITGIFGAGGITITAVEVGATLAAFAAGWASYEVYKWNRDTYNQVEIEEQEEAKKEEKEKNEKFKFPENPDDLLPELPRDKKGRIQTADNLRIRPEKHELEFGKSYNPRHHEQHYHVETRRDPFKSGWRNENKEVIKPPNYKPGMGTGFLPGENFPGV